MAHTCNPSTLGGQDGQITRVQELETSLANMIWNNLSIKINNDNKRLGRARWLTLVILALWEAEVGGSPEHFGRPRWVDDLRSGVQDQPGQHGKTPSLLLFGRLGQENHLNPGDRDCSKPKSCHFTPAWAKEQNFISNHHHHHHHHHHLGEDLWGSEEHRSAEKQWSTEEQRSVEKRCSTEEERSAEKYRSTEERRSAEEPLWEAKAGGLLEPRSLRLAWTTWIDPHSLKIYFSIHQESEITDFFLGALLKDNILKITLVQKQTHTGQRTRFKAFVAIGDYNGHISLGVKCSKEVATAIHGAMILAKLSTGGTRSTSPTPSLARGTGFILGTEAKMLLMMAGIDDCYTSARGCTATLGNFTKATFDAISKIYSYLTPELRKETGFTKSPYQ
ncbi:40S ribosomal protein S2 [Plecturocebus cupreus]